MEWLNFIVAVLAVYRVSRILVAEGGPFNIMDDIRLTLENRFPQDRDGRPHWINEGLACPLCTSFWLSLPAGFWLAGFTFSALFWWLGVAGAVVVVYRKLE